MRYKIITVAVAAIVSGLLLSADPAHGAQPAQHFPDGGWELGEWGPGATSPTVPASASIVQSATVLDLTKPAGNTGVSMETTDLGLTADGDTQLSVSWEADQSGLTVAGAVRLFWYDIPDADTFGQAPTDRVCAGYDDAACLVPNTLTEGTLSMTVPDGSTVGTVGLTYDASNLTAGTVTFTELRFGDTLVLFLEPPASPSPDPVSPSPTDSGSPSPTPTDTASPSPSASPTDNGSPSPTPTDIASPSPTGSATTSPTPVAGGAGGEKPGGGLPLTGLSLLTLGGAGLIATGAGIVLRLVRRRRTPDLTDATMQFPAVP